MAPAPSRRIIVGALSALLLALGGASNAGAAANPPFTEEPATAAAVACTEIIVYATRGANENLESRSTRAPGQFEADGVTPRSKYYDGLGEELLPIYSNLRDLYAPGTVSLVTNRAPSPDASTAQNALGGTDPDGPTDVGFRAVGVTFTKSAFYDYALSINEGKRAAVRDLDTIHERCPGSKLVVLGYSAGGEITRRALASLDWQPEPGRAMAVVFGDPTWRSGEKNLSYVGDTKPDQIGSIRAAKEGDFGLGFSVLGYKIATIPSFPAGWDATTYCHGGDLSCQWHFGAILAHESYHDEDAVGAAARIAGSVGGTFVRPVVTAKLTLTRSCYRRGSNLGARFKIQGVQPGERKIIKGRWELTPFEPFRPFRLSTTQPEGRRGFYSGLFSRLVLEVDGHKLDYRNVC